MYNKNIMRLAAKDVPKGTFSKGSTGYRTVYVLFFLSATYALMCCLAAFMSFFFRVQDGNTQIKEMLAENADGNVTDLTKSVAEFKQYLFVIIISVVIIIACIVFTRIKKLALCTAVLGCVNCPMQFSTFYSASALNNYGKPGKFFWSFLGLPSIVFAVLSVAVGVMLFMNRRALIGKYNDMTEKLYEVKSEGGKINISPDEFEKMMDEYNGEELFRTDIPLKKSQRRRKEKQDREAKD